MGGIDPGRSPGRRQTSSEESENSFAEHRPGREWKRSVPKQEVYFNYSVEQGCSTVEKKTHCFFG